MLVSYINFWQDGVYLRIPLSKVPDGNFMKFDLFEISLAKSCEL